MNQNVDLNFAAAIAAVADEGLMVKATCTVQRFNGTLGSTGAPARQTASNWADVTGMVNIPCMVASGLVDSKITNSMEVKKTEAIAAVNVYHVLLNAFYAAVQPTDRLKVTSGAGTRTLDITGVESDTQETMTRLAVQEYRL